MPVGMVVTDLDGTLLGSERQLSERDRRTLLELGRRGIARVVATGRSLFSARRVLAPDFPIDFIAHSSGAGISSWPDQRELRVHHMAAPLAAELIGELVARQLDFMLHRAIPDNHRFYAHRSGGTNLDFERRVQLYATYAEPLRLPFVSGAAMCQGLVIAPASSPGVYAALRDALSAFQVIRATSPLDGCSTWVEIFPPGVSKAQAASWLRHHQGLAHTSSVAVGNDYNDVDLLDWADLAYVTENAPAELRGRYAAVASNDKSGFSEAVSRALA